jgi:hypothetical protein
MLHYAGVALFVLLVLRTTSAAAQALYTQRVRGYSGVRSAAFFPNGKLAALASTEILTLMDLETWKESCLLARTGITTLPAFYLNV